MKNKTSWGTVAPLILAFLYGASPLDLIPDIIPIVGYLDDAFIVPILLLMAFLHYRRSKQSEALAKQPIYTPVRKL